MTIKINYGSGKEYLEGYINIDIDPNVKADLHINPNATTLPFGDATVDYIFSKFVLEHTSKSQTVALVKEFHRILKQGGRLELYLPHFTGVQIKYLDHKQCFGVGSFNSFNIEHNPTTMCNDQYPQFRIIKEEIHLLPTMPTEFALSKLSSITKMFDWIFNIGGNVSKQFWEKYLPGGFEELHIIMEKPYRRMMPSCEGRVTLEIPEERYTCCEAKLLDSKWERRDKYGG